MFRLVVLRGVGLNVVHLRDQLLLHNVPARWDGGRAGTRKVAAQETAGISQETCRGGNLTK